MNINATLIGQSITFFIFAWFCMAFVWPPLIKALRERQQRIADGLDAASRATRDLELAKEKVAEELRQAKAKAQEIIEEAKKRSNQLVEEARGQAEEEAKRVKQQAQADIEQQLNGVKEALRAQLGGLAVSGAERILGSSIDPQAHAKLVEQLAAEI